MSKTTALLALLLVAGPSFAQPSSRDPEEIAQRIRELRHEIDTLLSELPPELRAEVERRLAEPERAPEPVPEPPPPEPPSEPVESGCNHLAPFDTDGDGEVDAVDRYWRYLHLWIDADADGQVAETEIVSAYDRGVKAIAVSLKTFRKGKDAVGEIAVGEEIRLDLGSDGLTAATTRGVLVVDATRLRRGDGPRLLGPQGEPLEGFQVLRKGLRWQSTSGVETMLLCP